jgi:streptogramin lyase
MGAGRVICFALFIFWTITGLGQVPNISYSTPKAYALNNAITSVVPSNTGGAVPATLYGTVSTLATVSANPSGIVTDVAGNVYITLYGNDRVAMITSSGVVTYLDTIYYPSGITIDTQDNLYVSDIDDYRVYQKSPGRAHTVFAGNGFYGSVDGPKASASFQGPGGLYMDAAGNIYVADQLANKIRKISPLGIVSTIAGSGAAGSLNGVGAAASFNNPDGIAVDAQGNIYVADTKNNLIRKITPAGIVSTLAGSGAAGNANGAGTAASFNYPTGVAVDALGNIFVADFKNNLIRKITPSGIVSTLAGNGSAGSTNGILTAASFNIRLTLTLTVQVVYL